MAIQVEDLVQAVAEGVLRAAEAHGGSTASGTAGVTAHAATTRVNLISQLSFEVRIRAGGIPPAQFLAPTAE